MINHTLLFETLESPEVKQAIHTLTSLLSPQLIELSGGDARQLPNVGNKSYAFVIKALELAKDSPDFLNLIDVQKFEDEISVFDLLREIYTPLTKLLKKINDTMTLSGSGAYIAALTYYGLVKESVKSKDSNTEAICEELNKYFPAHFKDRSVHESKMQVERPA